MKTVLTTLWIIIIAGSVFIAITIFKPNSDIEENITPPETTEITEISEINKIPEINDDPNIGSPDTPIAIEEIENGSTKATTYTEHLAVGDTYRANNYLDSAIKEYQKAVNLNSTSKDPLIRLAETYLDNNQPQEANATFTKAQELDNNSLNIKIGIARSLLAAREIEKAKDLVWTLDTSNYTVKYYTSLVLILYQDFEGAKNTLSEIANSNPPASQELRDKAEIFLSKFRLFEYFDEESPLFLQLLLAKSFIEVEEYAASIPLLFDIINEKGNYRDAWIILGYAYLKTDKLEDAFDALGKAEDLDPEKAETLFYLGLTHFANDEIEKAIFYLEKAEDEGYEPKDQLNLKLGDLYLLQEKPEQAALKYEEIIASNPSNLEIFVRATWLNIDKLDKPKRALEIAEEALESFPDSAMSHNLVGWSYVALDKNIEAKSFLLKAIEIDPNLDAAYLNLGLVYENQKLISLAKEHYKQAYNLGQNNAVGQIALNKYKSLEQSGQKNYYQADITSPSSP